MERGWLSSSFQEKSDMFPLNLNLYLMLKKGYVDFIIFLCELRIDDYQLSLIKHRRIYSLT